MIQIAVKDLQIDHILGKSIYGLNNKLMLGAGYRITPEIKVKLIERGYLYVYIMEEGTENVTPQDIISDEVRMLALTKMESKAEEINQLLKFKELSRGKLYELINSGYLQNITITHNVKTIVHEMLSDIAAVGVKFLNSMLFKSKSTYLFDHSLNTTIISILIGKRYGFTKTELSDLAVGAFLHDFGKIVIDKLDQSRAGGDLESMMKEHPTFGYLIVRNSRNASPISCQIINQHHEFQDGSGYPSGLTGENLPPIGTAKRKPGSMYRLAEIVVVANVFDNLLFNQFHQRKLSPVDAVKKLLEGKETLYNKDIIATLVQIVPAFPEASLVRVRKLTGLNSPKSFHSYTAVVAKINEEALHRPVIILIRDKIGNQISPQVIDTSKLREVELELIL